MSEKNDRKQNDKQAKKKESILELNKYLDKAIRVKFQGGREASGILKGYELLKILFFNNFFRFDQLLNLVIDSTTEQLRDVDDPYRPSTESRNLGKYNYTSEY
jgi:U6 snRNA-associated Sm-like protein LSm7